jgi:glycosyltransferase involved in cell wall biosynthesis
LFTADKLSKTLWTYSHLRALDECFSRSALALLQGQDVFHAYKDIASNPHKVLNFHVSWKDHISDADLGEKLVRIRARGPLTISYAGRMIDMKGPFDWIKTLHRAVRAGIDLRATWFGEGSLMPNVQREAKAARHR